MTKVINGKTYRSHTAHLFVTLSSHFPRTSNKWHETSLHRTQQGTYFLAVNRNFKRPFCLDRKVSKDPWRGQIRSLCHLTGGSPPARWGGGSHVSWIMSRLSLQSGTWGGETGKGGVSALGTEPESSGGIKLSGRTRRGGPGLWVGRGSASPGGSESCRSLRGLQWRRGWSRARRTVGTW